MSDISTIPGLRGRTSSAADSLSVDLETETAERTNADADHVADADPHAGYQQESEKDAAGGYLGLKSSPVVFTQTYNPFDPVFGGYAADPENVAYTGIDNAQVGTVYMTVADGNALRIAYENLRAFAEDHAKFTNSLINELRDQGVIG